jgi:hypothetical protein
MPEAAFLPDKAVNVSTTSSRKKAAQPSLPRDAAIDLRIGLNMLGEEGRRLLAEYVTIKQKQASEKISQQ